MRTVYLDSEFICHVEKAEGLRGYETDFFDDACDTLIEGYRCVPEGETWTRSDGVTFSGEMIAPVINYAMLSAAQKQFEEDNRNMMPLSDVAELVEIVYEQDLEMIG